MEARFMRKFDKYFTMKESDAAEYAANMLDYFDKDAILTCKEIGDGNLNYVFRVIEEKTGKSVIIKQAGPEARISSDIKVSPDRNRIESNILKLEGELAKGLVPEVYKYDSVMNCCIMEDLSDHTILRQALLQHKKFPRLADDITTFMVNTLLLTSDVVMDHKKKKQMVKDFINPELCEITEDLVYTEPFYDCLRNDMLEETKEFAKSELWEDEKFLLETVKLKFEFMTNSQSLIHGDLHTGSIFVKEDSTKVIDPEFAFYGPAGYDTGNVIANLIFAFENADATIADAEEKEDYRGWLEETIANVVDLFSEKFNEAWELHATERVVRYKGFREYYLGTLLHDTAAIGGLELCRRTLGLAHVKDITSILDMNKRIRAEKICLSIGKRYILESDSIRTGKQFMDVVKEYEARF
jgi:5-methylthioribose kinase